MIYVRSQITLAGGVTQGNTMFDMTIHNTGDSPDAGTVHSKSGNYDVTHRLQDRGTITKTKIGRIEGFPRKEYDGVALVFLALYGVLGKERGDTLIKKMKKGVKDAKTRRVKKLPKANYATTKRGS